MVILFCCDSVRPYKPRRLDHDAKFTTFMSWASFINEASDIESLGLPDRGERPPSYAVQLVQQVDNGPVESSRYFIPVEGQDGPFVEMTAQDLEQMEFSKLNSFKNYKCIQHDKFFEVNLYQKNPVNKHGWRNSINRPASSIDL